VINIGLNFYFIPRYGFVGAAITTLISYFISFLISYIISNRIFTVEHKTIRNFVFYFTGLAIAAVFPFLELKYKMPVPIYIKIISLSSILFIPFLLGVLQMKDITMLRTLFSKNKGHTHTI
jgi:peptidoglycan biosynthesis protein MviN/MurJ (putative lipid II flippase)